MWTCSVYVPGWMKMHWGVVVVLLRALTADWKVLCWDEVAVLLTTRHPDGGEVRSSARTVCRSDSKYKT
jgi:hypothetical protein